MYVLYMEHVNAANEKYITSNKKFLWKDKSGIGMKSSTSLSFIMEQEDEENWDGDSLKEWAMEAEEGDEWENATDKYICTQS
jgi:hypothetical protein